MKRILSVLFMVAVLTVNQAAAVYAEDAAAEQTESISEESVTVTEEGLSVTGDGETSSEEASSVSGETISSSEGTIYVSAETVSEDSMSDVVEVTETEEESSLLQETDEGDTADIEELTEEQTDVISETDGDSVQEDEIEAVILATGAGASTPQWNGTGANVPSGSYVLPEGFEARGGYSYGFGGNVRSISSANVTVYLSYESEYMTQLSDNDFILRESETSSQALAQNTQILQNLIDAVSASGGGEINIGCGTYYFGVPSDNYLNDWTICYCIEMKDNVTISGTPAADDTIATWLDPYGDYKTAACNMFQGWDVFNADFRDLGIDSANCRQSTGTYNCNGKGFMFIRLSYCDWYNVIVKNTIGTGFGVDGTCSCTMKNCTAAACGRGASKYQNGGSGFGIGYGYSSAESMLIEDCLSVNNRKFGFFFESQYRFHKDVCLSDISAHGDFIVRNCVSAGNLNNYGGEMCVGAWYINCESFSEASGYSDPLGVTNMRSYYFGNNYTEGIGTSSRSNYIILPSESDAIDASKGVLAISARNNTINITLSDYYCYEDSFVDDPEVFAYVWTEEGGKDDLKTVSLASDGDGTYMGSFKCSDMSHNGTADITVYARVDVKVNNSGSYKNFLVNSGETEITGATIRNCIVQVDDKYYAYDSSGNKIRNGTPVINGKKYWCGSDGALKSGWLSLCGSYMYFDPDTYAACTNGIYQLTRTVNGENITAYFAFDSNGIMYQNATPVINGKKYYCSSTGALRSGWLYLGKWKMYFDPETYCAAVGFNEINGKMYLFNKDGVMQNYAGTTIIDGGKYWFSTDDASLKTGWLTLGSWRLYFDKETYAAYVSTTATIDGVKYSFDCNGVASVVS